MSTVHPSGGSLQHDSQHQAGPARERAAAWIYSGIWKFLVDWFRVPPEPPTLPSSSPAAVRVFQPSLGFLRYLKFQFWIFLAVTDAIFTGLWIALIVAIPWLGLLITPIALAIIILPDIVAYIAIHLRFDTTWYVLSDRSLRIRRGIWIIHETTLTYDNIQNVKIVQGPLERYFGIANVMVETAGGGGGDPATGTMGPHVGRIEGVSNAAEIRELIMNRVSAYSSSGLGDDDDHEALAADRHLGWSEDHLAVLREIAALVGESTQEEIRN